MKVVVLCGDEDLAAAIAPEHLDGYDVRWVSGYEIAGGDSRLHRRLLQLGRQVRPESDRPPGS